MEVRAEDKVIEIEVKFRLPKNQYFVQKIQSVQELREYVNSNILIEDIKHFMEDKNLIEVDKNPFRFRSGLSGI